MTKTINIRVRHSGLVHIQGFDDFPDGYLMIAEGKKHIPFAIKRVYWINNLFNKKAIRGKHAHKQLDQVIFCINGKFTLTLDDGTTRQSITMDDPTRGVRLGPRLWHTMKNFSKDCLILVVASDYFKETDYIRDYHDFLNYAKQHA